jgi:hypothetical protein
MNCPMCGKESYYIEMHEKGQWESFFDCEDDCYRKWRNAKIIGEFE